MNRYQKLVLYIVPCGLSKDCLNKHCCKGSNVNDLYEMPRKLQQLIKRVHLYILQ